MYGIQFDSKKEAERYLELRQLQDNGFITDLQVQIPFEIVPKTDKFRNVKYIADFVYIVHGAGKVAEDVKGYRKGAAYSIFKVKQKLMYWVHGIEVMEI